MESKKIVRPVSTVMRIIKSKDGGLSSYFDKFNEHTINNTSFKEILNKNHTTQANKGKVFGILRLEHFSDF